MQDSGSTPIGGAPIGGGEAGPPTIVVTGVGYICKVVRGSGTMEKTT